MRPEDHANRPHRRIRQRRTSADRLRAALLELADGQASVLAHSEHGWASITFTGARHAVTLAFDGAAAVAAGEAFVAALPEHEFTLPGQLVAEADIRAVDHRLLPTPRMEVRCALLLLEDA